MARDKMDTNNVNASALYVDPDDGHVKDATLDEIYRAFYEGELTKECVDNFNEYIVKWFPGGGEAGEAAPLLDVEKCHDLGYMVDWAFSFGFLTLWQLYEEVMVRDGLPLDDNLEIGAKIGAIHEGQYVGGKTPPLAVGLAVVQMFREISMHIHNQSQESTLLH